jgi:DNA-binding beta-propeller fold protein YncE
MRLRSLRSTCRTLPVSLAAVAAVAAGPAAASAIAAEPPAFVAAGANVRVVDTGNYSAGATIAVGGTVQDVAVSPDGNTAYATNENGVTPITNNAAGVRIPLANAGSIAITPDGNALYVTHGTSVTRIDTSGNAMTPIAFADATQDVAISPDGKTATS